MAAQQLQDRALSTSSKIGVMKLPACLACSALAIAIGAQAQSEIQIGETGTIAELGRTVPGLSGLVGPKGTGICIAYRRESTCDYILTYGAVKTDSFVTLLEVQRRPESGDAVFSIVDVVAVPAEFASTLESVDCRYDGYAHGDDMVQPFVSAMDVAGEPGTWVGPADWVLVADFENKELVEGDPQLVECWIPYPH